MLCREEYMKTEIHIEELLRWRLARAESEAPRAPCAADLLESIRPWWDTWPEKFQAAVRQLTSIRVGLGHAMAEPRLGRVGLPIAVLVIGATESSETTAKALYFSIRDDKLRFRFQLDLPVEQASPDYEVSFVSDRTSEPLFVAEASSSVETEYCIEVALPVALAREWESLKVTDRMPFRLILRTDKESG